MRYTLLDMTQQILSSMDSDEVNSIDDTVESLQVANIIRQCYYDMAADLNLPIHERIIQLTASGVVSRPCIMSIPENVITIEKIYYDVRKDGTTTPDYRLLEQVSLAEFIERNLQLRNQSSTDVGTQVFPNDGTNTTFFYKKLKAPEIYASVGGGFIVFDGLDTLVDSTLQTSKTLVHAHRWPSFSMTDAFYPELDPSQFPMLLQKAKTRAFKELKQQDNAESVREERNQKIAYQKRKDSRTGFDKVPKFGRK